VYDKKGEREEEDMIPGGSCQQKKQKGKKKKKGVGFFFFGGHKSREEGPLKMLAWDLLWVADSTQPYLDIHLVTRTRSCVSFFFFFSFPLWLFFSIAPTNICRIKLFCFLTHSKTAKKKK
jgi:hypothetical protein